MPLLDRNGWKPDDYQRGEAPVGGKAVIVPFAAAEATLAAGADGSAVGVDLPNDIRAEALAGIQDRIGLIAIAFPAFTDGRGFSLARALRGQGYRGRLRASGELIPDQFAFALSCGFDEIEIDEARAERQPVEQWLEQLRSVGDSYQDKAEQPSIFARRAAAA